MYLHGLTGLRKSAREADLAIYINMLGVPGQYKSVEAINFISCCPNKDGFCRDSHI